MFPSSGAIFKSTAIMTMSKSELSKSLTVELIVVKREDRQTDRRTDEQTTGKTDNELCMLHRLYRNESTGGDQKPYFVR